MWWGGWGGAVEACVRRGEEDSSLCTGTGKDDDDAKLLLTHVSLFFIFAPIFSQPKVEFL